MEAHELEAVWLEHASAVRGYLFARGEREHIDELLQDTLIELSRALAQFEGRSTLRTFVIGCAKTVLQRFWTTRHHRWEKTGPDAQRTGTVRMPDSRRCESASSHGYGVRVVADGYVSALTPRDDAALGADDEAPQQTKVEADEVRAACTAVLAHVEDGGAWGELLDVLDERVALVLDELRGADPRLGEVLRLLSVGETRAAIARKLGVDVKTVYNWLAAFKARCRARLREEAR